MLIRYSDDFVIAFQYQHDAQLFYRILGNRLRKFNLELAKDKTHLIRFSRFHPSGRPDRKINFLGFECYWGKDHQGEPRLKRVTSRKRHKLMLSQLYQWIKKHRSKRPNITMPTLKRKLVGIQNYFGVPDNSKSISRIYNCVLHALYKWLNKRSQRQSFNWRGFKDMLKYFQIKALRVSKRLIAVDWY